MFVPLALSHCCCLFGGSSLARGPESLEHESFAKGFARNALLCHGNSESERSAFVHMS